MNFLEFQKIKSFGELIIFKHYHVQTQDKNKIHPTQKPIELYKWIFNKYSKPNFKILDTHFGSGSIAIAFDEMVQYWISQNLDVDGAELIACELDKEYYEKAVQRIKDHTSQLKLF